MIKYRYDIDIRSKIDIIPQIGMQEAALLSSASFVVVGGNRGGGKSHIIITDPLYDINNKNFTAQFFRKETGEIIKGGGLYSKAEEIYPHLGGKGTALKFKFPSGSIITFDHIQNESQSEVEKRFRGLELPAIYIDEINQFKFSTILKLMESNRNSHGIRNRMIGTCNPDPDSWLRHFLSWYIDEGTGYIIPERDRAIRYFYIYGKTVEDIIWGNSKDEVYESAKIFIDNAWDKRFEDAGMHKYDLIKSFQFIKGDLAENKKLLESDPSYLANIAQGGAASIAVNLQGNWNIKDDIGEEMVSKLCMDDMFDNSSQTTGRKRMSVDVALEGKDSCVIFVWDGLHIIDVIERPYLKSDDLRALVVRIKEQYDIRETDVYYDKVGNGSAAMDIFPSAVGIEANGQQYNEDRSFDKNRSKILWKLGILLQEGKISCDEQLSYKLFNYGIGTKKAKKTLREILFNERRVLIIDESSGKTKMLKKKGQNSMLSMLGFSPNFLDAFAYGIVHTLINQKKGKEVEGLENL